MTDNKNSPESDVKCSAGTVDSVVSAEYLQRQHELLPEEMKSNFYFQVHDFDDYFPFSKDCGKMSRAELALERVDERSISYSEVLEGIKREPSKGQIYAKKRNN